MIRQSIRILTLALILIALACPYLHAASHSGTSGTPPTIVANDGPTGGDPEPPGSSVLSIALMLLQMGIE